MRCVLGFKQHCSVKKKPKTNNLKFELQHPASRQPRGATSSPKLQTTSLFSRQKPLNTAHVPLLAASGGEIPPHVSAVHHSLVRFHFSTAITARTLETERIIKNYPMSSGCVSPELTRLKTQFSWIKRCKSTEAAW